MRSQEVWIECERLLGEGRVADAVRGYRTLASDPGFGAIASLRLSLLAMQAGDMRSAAALAVASHGLRQPDPVLLGMITKCLLSVGERQLALRVMEEVRDSANATGETYAMLGGLANTCDEPQLALSLLKLAEASGITAASLYCEKGLALMHAGNLPEAESELDNSLERDPCHARSLWLLAKMSRYSARRPGMAMLQDAIRGAASGSLEMSLLHYARFHFLDGRGEIDDAWSSLSAGMKLRRSQVSYDRTAEAAMFKTLSSVAWGEGAEHHSGPIPIFIVGMPRSGTTLLERILGSHSDVSDGGELRDSLWQLRWAANRAGPPRMDHSLAASLAAADPNEFAARYLSHTQWRAKGRAFYTDKLPSNFAILGHIASSMPGARILHMVRDPMDTCFSNLKEFFASTYPHTCQQEDMAAHYGNYRRMMDTWHERLPGRILDVHYDRLVVDPEAVCEEVLLHCGLRSQPGLTAIESRSDAVSTASALQVREPIHNRSSGRWHVYAAQLEPMRKALAANGVLESVQ